MELYDALIAFKSEQAKKGEPSEQRATVSVQVRSYDDRKREHAVVIAGNNASSDYALPADVSAADFVHAVLRLEPGRG